MKGNKILTGTNSPKNQTNKYTNKPRIGSPKNTLPSSSKNSDSISRLSINSESRLGKWKSQKDLREQNSQISTQDMQQKHELLEQSLISDKNLSQNLNKKLFVKGSSKGVGLGSPKNINLNGKMNSQSNIVKSKLVKQKVNSQNQKSAEQSFVSIQIQNEFMKHIQQLQLKIIQFEKQMQDKDNTIEQIRKQNKQLNQKYSKLSNIQAENRKLLRQKVMKFNEQGQGIRKLKQRIAQLQSQIQSLKQNKLTYSQVSFLNINQVQSQWVQLNNNNTQLSQSYIFKMLQSKYTNTNMTQGNDDNNLVFKIKKQYDTSLAQIQLKFNQLFSSQQQKIREKQGTIKQLQQRLTDALHKQTSLQQSIQQLKQQNQKLRNNIIQNLKDKLQTKSFVREDKLRKKQQIQNRLNRILQISKKQKEMFYTMNTLSSSLQKNQLQ